MTKRVWTEKDRERSRKWKHEHKEQCSAYRKQWRLDNPEKERENERRRYQRDKEKRDKLAREWASNNRELINQRANAKNREIRLDVLTHYGGHCVCCGETTKEFLAIDHINGDGNKQRKSIGSSSTFYRWVKKNNYPEYLQILCHNCNMAKGFYGGCPHESFRLVGLVRA